jgi:HEAT repeat protein
LSTFDHAAYANALARAIALLRVSPEGGEEQQAAVRVLHEFSAAHSATVRFYEGVLTVEDQELPLDDQAFAFLASRLRVHDVVEIVVARGADPAEVVALVRGLASEAGQGRIKERLRDASSTRVMVILDQPQVGQRKAPSVSQAFAKAALDEAALAEWNRFLSSAAQASTDKQVDLGISHAAGPAQPPEAAPPADAWAAEPPAPPPVTPPTPPQPELAPAPAPAAPARAPRPTLALTSPLGMALEVVLHTPYGSDILGRLTPLERHLQNALTHDKVPEAIDALSALVDLEAKAPDDQARGSYAIILQRVLNRASIVQIAPYAFDAKRAERATTVLRRGGEITADYLVGFIGTASTLAERVAYLHVLRGVASATDRVIAMLSRPEWQVVRNAAEALGEVHVRESVPFLARLLEHEDERVRRAAMVALARIGTGPTVEPLRRVLREGTPEQRALVASSVDGPHARALVGSLVAFTETEKHPDVLRETCRALGRIGTQEAVQALARLAQPGGKLLARKPTPLRLAAVEGLRLAGGSEAAKALEALLADGDRAVREAAQAARATPAGRPSSGSG